MDFKKAKRSSNCLLTRKGASKTYEMGECVILRGGGWMDAHVVADFRPALRSTGTDDGYRLLELAAASEELESRQ
jgi:hypothetical protein